MKKTLNVEGTICLFSILMGKVYLWKEADVMEDWIQNYQSIHQKKPFQPTKKPSECQYQMLCQD